MKRFGLLLIIALSSQAFGDNREQLKDFRAKLVKQKMVINGMLSDLPFPTLAEWSFVKEKKGVYVNTYKSPSVKYIGRRGEIIAIQSLPDNSDNAYVGHADAIIRLDSGELLKTAVYSAARDPGEFAGDAFSLVTLRERHKQEALSLAQRLTGKQLYLSRMNKIYDMGVDLTNIEGLKAGVRYSEARITNVPLLTPLPIVEVRYSDDRDFALVILQLPDGRRGVYIPGCFDEKPSAGGNERLFSPRISGKPGTDLINRTFCAATYLPEYLTSQEIEAIRKSEVFVGMSEPALYMAIGTPKDTNESIVGHTQLIYASAYIYLDQDKKISEVQKHD